jgi:hypothetical protein
MRAKSITLAGGTVAGMLGLLAAVWVSAAPRPALREFTTKDGKTVVGELVRDQGGVLEVRLPDSAIVQIKKAELAGKPKDFDPAAALKEFEDRKAKLPADNDGPRIDLGQWAEARNMKPQALELYKAGRSRIAQAEADRLEKELKKAPDGTGTNPVGPVTKAGPTGSGDPSDTAVVLEEPEIRLVRIREYRAGENPLFRLLDKNIVRDPKLGAEFKPFASQPVEDSHLLAARKLAAEDPALLAKVDPTRDPAVLDMWMGRTKPRTIQNILVQRCATAKCHGGGTNPDGSKIKFQLLTGDALTKGTAARREGAAVGNFDYLRRYSKGDLMNHSVPQDSPLVQYGLAAKDKEPTFKAEIRKHASVWRSLEDPDYKLLVEWIGLLRRYNEVFPEKPATPTGGM